MEAAIARSDNEAAALIGLRDGVGFTDAQLTRMRADPSWPARPALAPLSHVASSSGPSSGPGGVLDVVEAG